MRPEGFFGPKDKSSLTAGYQSSAAPAAGRMQRQSIRSIKALEYIEERLIKGNNYSVKPFVEV